MAVGETSTVSDVMSIAGGVLRNPRHSHAIRRILNRATEAQNVIAALSAELQTGVLGSGAEPHIRAQIAKQRDFMNHMKGQAKIKAFEAAQEVAGPTALGKAAISAASVVAAKAIETGALDFEDKQDTVASSVRTGLEETVSPGDLTAPRSMPNLRLQQAARRQGEQSGLRTSPTSGPSRPLGEDRPNLALDPGERILGMAPELGSVQAIDPDAPYWATSPQLGSYEEARATEGATPVTGVRQLPSLAEQQAPLGQTAEIGPSEPALVPLGRRAAPEIPLEPIQKTKKDVGDMTIKDLASMAASDPEKVKKLLESLYPQGGM